MASTSSGWALRLAIATAILAAIGVIPLLMAVSTDQPAPEVVPPAGIRIIPKDVNTVPEVSVARSARLLKELNASLKRLYDRAFQGPTLQAQESPTPIKASSLASLFTREARTRLNDHPTLFTPPDNVRVASGDVSYKGFFVIPEEAPMQASLFVNFIGTGSPAGQQTPAVRITQSGRMQLVRKDGNWLVQGFDLKLDADQVRERPETRKR